MRLNVIHLAGNEHSQERHDLMMKELSDNGITDYRIWDGVHHQKAHQGIRLAHQNVVRWAKETNEEKILIAEDDFHLTDKGAFEYFLEHEPEDYDLYLSSIYWGRIKEDQTVDHFCGLTMYIIKQKFYDTFLSLGNDGKAVNHVDRALGRKGKYVVSEPFTTRQHAVYSYNRKGVPNYDRYLLGRNFFKGG